jgi:hypothetical protein
VQDPLLLGLHVQEDLLYTRQVLGKKVQDLGHHVQDLVLHVQDLGYNVQDLGI